MMGQSSGNSSQPKSSPQSDEETAIRRLHFPLQPIDAESAIKTVSVQQFVPQTATVVGTSNHPCVASLNNYSAMSALPLYSTPCVPPQSDLAAMSQPLLYHSYYFNLMLLAEAALSQNLSCIPVSKSDEKPIHAPVIETSQPPSVPEHQSSSYVDTIRSRNNEACRKSRIKRKKTRQENETRLKILCEGNSRLKQKIIDLETEVNEAKNKLIDKMNSANKPDIKFSEHN